MREKILFAEERFDIQPLPLQNFPQATQTFHLDLPHTLAGEANFTAHIFQRGCFITQQTETTRQNFTLFASYHRPAWCLPGRSLSHRPEYPAALFLNRHPAEYPRR